MNIEFDGKTTIVRLEKGEDARIITATNPFTDMVEVKNIDGSLKVTDNIGLTESRVDTESVIGRCNNWLQAFKEQLEEFEKYVSSRADEDGLIVLLEFKGVSYLKHNNISRRKIVIELSVMQGTYLIKKGVSVEIDSAEEDVYKYLLASTFEYYVSRYFERNITANCQESLIYQNKGRNIICAVYKTLPMYKELLVSIMRKNNLGMSNDDTLYELLANIGNKSLNPDSIFKYGSTGNNFEKRLKK